MGREKPHHNPPGGIALIRDSRTRGPAQERLPDRAFTPPQSVQLPRPPAGRAPLPRSGTAPHHQAAQEHAARMN